MADQPTRQEYRSGHDPRTLRDALGCFATGVTVVTCLNSAGDPSPARQVTTVTPVAKQPNASRKVRGSCPLRYSCRVGWSAMSGL